MNGKKIAAAVLIALLMAVLAGCPYAAYKDYYTDTADYEKIWTLTGFRHGYDGISPFFPQSLAELDVKEFFCRYDQQLPLGEGVQVFLEIQYADETQLRTEIERISPMSFACDEYFEDNGISAYATRLGENYSSEYVLIDKENLIIYYIFLHGLPREEIEIESRFIPTEYTEYWKNTK